MSSGTVHEPTPTIWGDLLRRRINARMVSDRDPAHEVDIRVDVIDFNDDQDPTVVLGLVADADTCLYLTAYDAERLGVFLIQAAAFSRQVEPGGPDPLASQHPLR